MGTNRRRSSSDSRYSWNITKARRKRRRERKRGRTREREGIKREYKRKKLFQVLQNKDPKQPRPWRVG